MSSERKSGSEKHVPPYSRTMVEGNLHESIRADRQQGFDQIVVSGEIADMLLREYDALKNTVTTPPMFKVGDTGKTRDGSRDYEITSVTSDYIYRGRMQPIEARVSGRGALHFDENGVFNPFLTSPNPLDLLPPTGNVNDDAHGDGFVITGLTTEQLAQTLVDAGIAERLVGEIMHIRAAKSVEDGDGTAPMVFPLFVPPGGIVEFGVGYGGLQTRTGVRQGPNGPRKFFDFRLAHTTGTPGEEIPADMPPSREPCIRMAFADDAAIVRLIQTLFTLLCFKSSEEPAA